MLLFICTGLLSYFSTITEEVTPFGFVKLC